MTSFLQLVICLAILITIAKFSGYISYKLGQPAVLGELLAGIILGPSLLNMYAIPYFSDQHLPKVIHQMAELGVLLLMFIAGLDLHISDLVRSGKVAALAGSFGVVLPLVLGTLTGVLFSIEIIPSVFIGLILSATSVSISAQTLMELKVLSTRIGVGLLGAAVFDDILVLLLMSIIIGLTHPISSGILGVVWIILQMLLFLVVASIFGRWILPKISRLVSRLPISQGLIALAFIILLFYGWSAEVFGQMAAITGAFFAGLWFGQTAEKELIRTGIAAIAYGLFVPVFFVNIGLSMNVRMITVDTLFLLLVMIIVAVIGKVLGSGLGALWGGFSPREALQLGTGMISRGEVGLIVATIGIEQGLIQESIYSAILGVVIVTTLLTPPLLRALFPKKLPPQERAMQASKGEGL